MLTPATAQYVMAIFQDIHAASSVAIVARGRKQYLAQLFSSLLRISAQRLKAVVADSASALSAGGMVGTLRPDTLVDRSQWQFDELVLGQQPFSDVNAQRLFERSIDDFFSQ